MQENRDVTQVVASRPVSHSMCVESLRESTTAASLT